MRELWTAWLGTVDYGEAHELQERLREARQAGRIPDVLLLLEHPPVYTRTRRTAASDLPRGEAWYAEQGIAIVDTDRGGQLTYHGPGQLVAYPIVEAGRILPFVRSLERAIVEPWPTRASPRTRATTSRPRSSARGSRTARSPRSASA